MKIAQVTQFGDLPAIHTVPDPSVPKGNEIQLRVIAAGVHQLVRSRAAGQHYSAKGLPHIPGVDGVGEDVNDPTKKYYFGTITPTGGSMQEIINVSRSEAVLLPENLSKEELVDIAASMNPLMASWMAFAKRIDWSVIDKSKGFTVLILGATTFSGKVAIPTARQFGATKVIGCARSAKKMEGLGLDQVIELAENASETDFSHLASATDNVDIVFDFLYGDTALAFFKTILTPKPLQYVQIGSVAGLDVQFPAAVLRSKDITVRGTGPGSWRKPDYFIEAKGMAEFLASGKVPIEGVVQIPFDDVEKRWEEKGGRMVVVM